MTASSCLGDKWWQNSLAPLEGARGQPEDRGHCLWSFVLKRDLSLFPPGTSPFLLSPKNLGFPEWQFGKGEGKKGIGKTWHKPRTKVLCEAGKGQVVSLDKLKPAPEPLEFQNPSLLVALQRIAPFYPWGPCARGVLSHCGASGGPKKLGSPPAPANLVSHKARGQHAVPTNDPFKRGFSLFLTRHGE